MNLTFEARNAHPPLPSGFENARELPGGGQAVWETELGERRSRVELTAEDIGASLTFATAEISRTQRSADVTDKEAVDS